MLHRLACVALLLALFSVSSPRANASPITYDFTGVLNQPYDGTTSFSGSFTIDPSTAEVDTDYISAGGSGSSMTVRFGDQVLNFVNNPSNPTGRFWFGVNEVPSWLEEPQGQPEYEIGVGGATQNGVHFNITAYVPGWVSDIPNLESLSFPSNSVNINPPAMGESYTGGWITSISVVPSPEPSTLIVFGALAAVVFFQRRYHKG